MNLSRRELWAVVTLIALGAALRLSFPDDIEYKADEKYMFEAAMNVGRSEPWPTTGMPSGAHLRNPPLSIWLFVVLARVSFVEAPPGLSRVVAVLNVAALVLLLLFALRRLGGPWRRAWAFGCGLVAVNPVAVQLQRKIWAQSVLPFFVALLFWAWSSRRTFAGAFFWGVIGALLGQIHMSGFFFAAALWLWTVLFTVDRGAVKWSGWFAGSAVGALPLIPWLQAIASGESGGAAGFRPHEVLYFRFHSFFATEPLGLLLQFSLGPKSFQSFLAFPAGTSLTGIVHLVLSVCGLAALALGAVHVWRHRASWRRWIVGRTGEPALLISAAALGYWLLLSLTTLRVFRHYLLVVYPLPYVLLAYVLLTHARGRRVLGAIAGAQLMLSVLFLSFVHVNEGAPDGDYGKTYGSNRPTESR